MNYYKRQIKVVTKPIFVLEGLHRQAGQTLVLGLVVENLNLIQYKNMFT